MKKSNNKKPPQWAKFGALWIYDNLFTKGFIKKNKKGYKVLTLRPSGDFYMGMEKYYQKVCYRKSLTEAKKEFITRIS